MTIITTTAMCHAWTGLFTEAFGLGWIVEAAMCCRLSDRRFVWLHALNNRTEALARPIDETLGVRPKKKEIPRRSHSGLTTLVDIVARQTSVKSRYRAPLHASVPPARLTSMFVDSHRQTRIASSMTCAAAAGCEDPKAIATYSRE